MTPRSVPRWATRLALALAVVIVLGGCDERPHTPGLVAGSTSAGWCPEVTGPAISSPAGSVPGSAAPSAVPTGTPSAVLSAVPFGTARPFHSDFFRIDYSVCDYRHPAGSAQPDPHNPDHEWVATDVQACARAVPDQNLALAALMFSLYFVDGTTVPITNWIIPGFQQPEFPTFVRMRNGQCVRGWITFSVPPGKRPTAVLFETPDDVYAWTVPPA